MRTKKFTSDYFYTQNFLGNSSIDEAILVDITRSGPSKASHDAMKKYADQCFVPTTMGGWIKSLDDVKRFFDMGADKVVLGYIAMLDPGFVGMVAAKWGAQAAVVAVDADGGVTTAARTSERSFFSPERYAMEKESDGAGEIFLQSKERDGSLSGYDLETLKSVVSSVKIPVIVGTSCGNAGHMKAAFDAGASGCATGCIHHFTENAIRGFKRQLGEYVRP
jgi:cyclase